MAVNQTSTPGGGGCPGSYDVLLPDLPFDEFQPQMVHGLTQAGYGGPFVIRGNPVGAVLDVLRNFCAPMPMQAQADGSYIDTSMMPYTDLGALGYAGGAGYGGIGGPGACYYGTDPNTGLCATGPVTTPATKPTTTPTTTTTSTDLCNDPTGPSQVGQAFANARSQGDIATQCMWNNTAYNCARSTNLPGLAAQWNLLQAGFVTQLALQGVTGSGCAKYLTGGGSGATNTGNTTPKTKTTCPPGCTPAVNGMCGSNFVPDMASGCCCPSANVSSFGGARGLPSLAGIGNTGIPGPVAISTPLPTGPTAVGGGMGIPRLMGGGGGGIISSAVSKVQNFTPYRMPALPEMPNVGSLTEGNIYLQPTAEPMGGSFAPERSIPTRVMRTPMQIISGFFGRR